jgi:hypothetical protein
MGNYVTATTIETDKNGPTRHGVINGGFLSETARLAGAISFHILPRALKELSKVPSDYYESIRIIRTLTPQTTAGKRNKG